MRVIAIGVVDIDTHLKASLIASSRDASVRRACSESRASACAVNRVERAGRERRQEVEGPDRTYHLRSSEWSTLRDVGTFRVVAELDLMRDAADRDVHRNDVRHLVDEGLLDRKTAIVNHQPTRLLVLTNEGKALLEGARRDSGDGDRQQYHSGLVKPRELAHDVQIYRAYSHHRMPSISQTPLPVTAERRDKVDKARDVWIKKLIDLSRRNNLLFYARAASVALRGRPRASRPSPFGRRRTGPGGVAPQ